MKKYKRALFTFSADPITVGHLDIIKKASFFCDHLVIVITNNPSKRYLFSAEECERLVTHAISTQLDSFSYELITSDRNAMELMLVHDCDGFIRGTRNQQDLVYEKGQLKLHSLLRSDIEEHTTIIEGESVLSVVSSTAVKGLAAQLVPVHTLCNMKTQARLQRVMHKQKVIGVTGARKCGKTTIIERAQKTLRDSGIKSYHIELDRLAFEIYKLCPDILEKTEHWSSYLTMLLRERLKECPGVVFVESTYLVEDGLLDYVNNNLIVIEPDESPVVQRLPYHLNSNPSFTIAGKRQEAQEKAQAEHFGTVICYSNKTQDSMMGLGGILVAKIRSGVF